MILWMNCFSRSHSDKMSLRLTPSKFFFLLITTNVLFLLFCVSWFNCKNSSNCSCNFSDYYEGEQLIMKTGTELQERENERYERLMNLGPRAFTKQLWNFNGNDTEKLYLYIKLLQKQHSFNETNIYLFRHESDNELGQNFSRLFMLDQGNTALRSNLYYNMNSMKKGRKPHFTVTEDFHKRLLPNISGTLKRYKRCSVVGNSGTLKGSHCGRQVDLSDFVFRCNAAPLKAFQNDTGTKSNVTSLNPSILKFRYKELSTQKNISNFLHDMKDFRGFLLASCFSTSSYIKLCLKMLQSYNMTENSLAMGHPDHFKKFCNFWSKRGLNRRLTTGFYFTNVALRHCDEVHLYGFWPFPLMIDEAPVKVPYHYFDNIKFDFQYKNRKVHFMDVEFSIFVQLHLHGLIKMHMGKCNDK